MTRLYFDLETYPIKPGLLAPPPVCIQWAVDSGGVCIEVGAEAIERRITMALRAGYTLIAHNAPFDMAVLCATFPHLIGPIFDAFEDGRVQDTQVRETLLLIAKGRLTGASKSLAGSCDRHRIDHKYNVGEDGKKDEYWRTRYAHLVDTPLARWPEAAVRYAKLDITNLRALYQSQERYPAPLKNQADQTRAAMWLHLASCWGMKTDRAAVEAFTERVEAEHVKMRDFLKGTGLVRADGTRNLAAAREYMSRTCARLGLPVQKTDTDLVSLAADTCKETGDETLIKYARYTSIAALRGRAWRMAAGYDTPIQPRFNTIVETGRTSCTKGAKGGATNGDQTQNVHQEHGVRECYVPRPGYALLSSDWSSAEMHTFAQVMKWQQGQLGQLGQALNAGRDPHSVMGCKLAGLSYDAFRNDLKHGDAATRKATKRFRSMAKPANFGFPGGMGITSFRKFAAGGYGMAFSEAEARVLKDTWMASYPEVRPYFKQVDRTLEINGGTIVHHMSERVRGDVSYCSACNSYFQGLAADMAKAAGWAIMRECYEEGGPLFGCRIVNFIHDEFLMEVPILRADLCARRVVEIMEDAGRTWCPDVPVRAEPALMLKWNKAAEPVYDADGKLEIWTPAKVA